MQNAFTAGELTPLLNSRTDAQSLYNNGCSKIENMTVFAQGGVKKRVGTKYIATASNSAYTVKLIPFEYSADEAYVLEFGHLYIRFYTDGGIVLDGASPYEIVSPYTAAEVQDIKYVQAADTYYITHKDHPVKKLVRNDVTDWTISDAAFVNGPFRDENSESTTITSSAITGSVTLTASASLFDSDHVGSFWKFRGSDKETTTVFDDYDNPTISSPGQYTDSLILNKGESLNLTVQGTIWDAVVSVQRSIDGGTTWNDFYVTSYNVAIQLTENDNDDVYYRAGIHIDNWESPVEADPGDDQEEREVKITIENTAAWGYAEVTGYTSATSVSATVKRTLPQTMTGATTRWSEGSWSAYRGYPRAVSFFEQRLVLAGNVDEPQNIWASAIDDYENFEPGTADDDSYNYTLVSNQLNDLLWLVENRVLHCGSLGGEWKFGSPNEATTPTSVDAKNQTSTGSSSTQGIVVDSSVVFIQRGGRILRSKIYDYNMDIYKSINISSKAQHLFDDLVTEIALQRGGTPTIWLVTDTGKLIGCTYLPEQSIVAYHQHTTDGEFESVTTIPNPNGYDDEIWVVVKRTINGSDKRYIEQFQIEPWTNIESACYSDCSIEYNGVASTTFSGVDHLEGEECVVLADGAVLPNVIISDGSFTTSFPAEQVIVGLPYTARVTTMPITPAIEAGTSVGKQAALWKIYLQLHDSIGCKVGSYANGEYSVDVLPFRSSADNMDEGLPLFTGIKEILEPEGFDQSKQLTVVSDQPLPLTLLSITAAFYASPA